MYAYLLFALRDIWHLGNGIFRILMGAINEAGYLPTDLKMIMINVDVYNT